MVCVCQASKMDVAQVVASLFVLVPLTIIEAHMEVSLGSEEGTHWMLSSDKLQIHVDATVPGGVYSGARFNFESFFFSR